MGNRIESEGNKGVDLSGRLGTTSSITGTYSRRADLVQTGRPNLLDHENPPGKSNCKHETTTGSTSPARPSPAPTR